MSYPKVIKADGSKEKFDPQKLRNSLLRAGAEQGVAEKVISEISKQIKDGDTTQVIYNQAFDMLRKLERGTAARYSLREGLAALGPSGFPFESYVARLFSELGYETSAGLYLQGECVKYEIDLLAENEEEIIIGEAKFHNQPNIKTDLKDVLYVHARFRDLEKTHFGRLPEEHKKHVCLLVTNTKYTSKAIEYAKCQNIRLIGWGYPKQGQNLEALVESYELQPITVLTNLENWEKKILLKEDIVLCRNIPADIAKLESLGIDKTKAESIVSEAAMICAV